MEANTNPHPQPQRVSFLALDSLPKTPKTAPKLTSVSEHDDMPGAFPQSVSPQENNTPTTLSKHIAKAVTGLSTPKDVTPIKPSAQEMHPKQFHDSTAKPMTEASWLGFSSMAPHTEPAKGSSKIAVAQGTPTKPGKAEGGGMAVTSPQFAFTFQRDVSLDLSEEARKMMAEKREEAARIRKMMVAEGQGEGREGEGKGDGLGRKMATPKGRSGRFSDVHMAQFRKFESIAQHPSAFRAEKNKASGKSEGNGRAEAEGMAGNGAKSLKRTLSKADLQGSSTAPGPLSRSPSKPSLGAATASSALPRPTSKSSLHPPPTIDASSSSLSSPAKRIKRAADDDTSTSRPKTSSNEGTPSTPKGSKLGRVQTASSRLSHAAMTPTQASLARAASVKTHKTSMIPTAFGGGNVRSPAKSILKTAGAAPDQTKPTPPTPLLSRSPSKPLFGTGLAAQEQSQEDRDGQTSPLLSRSPSKFSLGSSRDGGQKTSAQQDAEKGSYLTRSPSKPSYPTFPSTSNSNSNSATANSPATSSIPLLSRSPTKAHGAGASILDNTTNNNPFAPTVTTSTPAKSTTLMSRFNLLRQSPKKSILRSPQRLYSNDPAKIARGTHFGTPPPRDREGERGLGKVPQTMPVLKMKRVEFSASTKGADTGTLAIAEKMGVDVDVDANANANAVVDASKQLYPVLPNHGDHTGTGTATNAQVGNSTATESEKVKEKKSARRKTLGGGIADFTFRAGAAITFAASPRAKKGGVEGGKERMSIRHVSEEAETMSKEKEVVMGKEMGEMKGQKRKTMHAEPSYPSLAGLVSPLSARQTPLDPFGPRSRGGKENTSPPINRNGDEGQDKEEDEDEREHDHRPAKRSKPNFASPSLSPSKPAPSLSKSNEPQAQQKTARKIPTLGVKPRGQATAVGSRSPQKGKGVGGSGGRGGGAGGVLSRDRLNALAMPKRR